MFRAATHSPIGLDFGSASIKAVQLRLGGKGPTLAATAMIPRRTPGAPIDREEFGRAARVLLRQGFSGSRVVLGVPSDKLICAALELPPRASGAPLDEIARAELARGARVEPANIESAWWPLPGTGRSGEGTHAIGVACRHEDASTLLDAAEDAGLRIIALDALPAALVRALTPLCAAGGLTGVLDLGDSACELLLLHERTLVYHRSMKDLGVGRVFTALAQSGVEASETAHVLLERVGCSVPDDLSGSTLARSIGSLTGQMIDGACDELRMSVSYAQRRFGSDLARVLITGPAAELPGVLDRAAKRLGGDVQLARASDLARLGSDTIAAGSALVRALGLALHPAVRGGSA